MPALVADALVVLALVAMLVTAFAHPRGAVELAVGVVAAGTVLTAGAVPWEPMLAELRALLPVVGFLAAILVVARLSDETGVFRAVGGLVARTSGSPKRMLLVVFATAALTTAVLSLDATVVLLTPLVVLAATGSGHSSRPGVHACVRLANSASLLLPVSNLTNLLALPALPDLSFAGFALVMAPVWLAVLVVEYAGHRLYFAHDLRPRAGMSEPAPREALPVFPLLVVALMLTGFAALSPLGVEPVWVALAAATTLAAGLVLTREARVGELVGELVHAAHLPFAGFVLCLGVVVAGLADTFLADVVRQLLPGRAGLPGLLVVALLATGLANVVNNLPATLLLVPLVAPLGTTAVLAALVGLGVGSGLTLPGSLANLLWRRTLLRAGQPASLRDFHLLAALVTPPALLTGVVVLWAWAPLMGRA